MDEGNGNGGNNGEEEQRTVGGESEKRLRDKRLSLRERN